MTALFDTGVLLDYLRGDRRAVRVLDAHEHRAISVISWLELMAIAPLPLREDTRGFLYSFERLSVSEAIADEALRLVLEHPGLSLQRALSWATARANQLRFVTADAEHLPEDASEVSVPYRRRAQRR